MTIDYRKFLYFVLFVFLFILFHSKWEQLISTILITPLLSYVSSTSINDIVLALVVAVFIWWSVIKIRHGFIIDLDIVLLYLSIAGIYFWYRSFENLWSFTGFYYYPDIKYLDLVIVPSLTITVLYLNYFLRRIKEKKRSQFIEDNPIEDSKQDIFRYQEYCKQIADRINGSGFNRAFAIGIIGEWGTGKTSMMNLIRQNLNLENQIVFQFNPWSSSSETSITSDFFDAFRKNLSPHHSGVSNIISKYSHNLMEKSDASFWRTLSIFSGKRTLKEHYEIINDILQQIQKQVVVLMDDLDRLDEQELQEVIKLIRNTANFHNTVFIVAYDRNYLIRAIKKINDYNAEVFLEKIFQLEITLPHYERSAIRQRIVQHLKSGLGESFSKEIEDVANETYLGEKLSLVSEFIVTLRDVSRFSNSLILNFIPIKDEVVFSDFFRLELLRYKFPSVYQLLYQKFDQFFDTSQEGQNRFVVKLKMNDQKLQLESFVQNNLSSLSVPENQLSKIVRLVKKIFPPNYSPSKENAHLSVRYSKSFSKYFAIRLFKGDLSETEFQNYRGKSQQVFNEYISDTVKQGLGWELKDRFQEINNFESKDDLEKIINAIFHLAKQPRGGSLGFSEYMEYPGKDLCDKFYNEGNKLAIKFYDGSIDGLRELIFRNFNEAKHPFHVESEIVRDILSWPVIEHFPLTISELETINLGYLVKFLNTESKFTNQIWWLYNSCEYKRWEKVGNELHSRQYAIPQAKNAVIEFAKNKDLHGFLDTIIDYDMWEGNKLSIRPIVTELFKSWDGFHNFLNGFNEEDKAYLKEFKKFAEEFKAKGYQERFEFEFNHFESKRPHH